MKGRRVLAFLGFLAIAALIASGSRAVAPEVQNLGDVVNSADSDFAPIVSPDGNYLYFTSDRPGGYGGQDIWVSERVNGQWTDPVNLGQPINDDQNQGPDSYYKDDETGEEFLFLTICGDASHGFCDLYRSERQADGTWGVPENLGKPVNSDYSDANASFDYVNKVLYFSSTRPGGIKGDGPKKLPDEASFDLWSAQMNDDGSFQEPVNLGAPINTPAWEGVAFFHSADQTIFFSSNGHGGQGGADIFRSKKLDDGWTEPEPITELNSPGNDMYLSIPASGDMAFFSSNNTGGMGQEDIYVAPVYFVLSPEAVSLRSLEIPTGERVTEAVQAGHIETLYFDLDSYFLNPSETAKLDKVVDFLNEHPEVTIELAGHACSMGDLDYNLILSKERADSAIKYLLKKGIAPERMKETYWGETRPAEPNDPVYGNPKNRRVEISILK